MEEIDKKEELEVEEVGIDNNEDGPVVEGELVEKTDEEKDDDLEFEPIPEEFRSEFSKEELDVYDSALLMQNNPETDIVRYWRDHKICEELLKCIDSCNTEEERNQMKDAAKDIVNMQAYQIAINAAYKKMNSEIKKSIPKDFAKSYFHNNNIFYGVIPDKNGNIRELKNPKMTDMYIKSIDIEDIISLLDDPKFIRKAKKDSAKRVRFKRHVDRVNLYLRQYYKNRNLTNKSPIINCANSIKYLVDAYKIDERIARFYYIALSELTKTWEPYNFLNAEFIYLCNMNAIVSCNIENEEAEPDASEAKFYNNIKLFFDKVKMIEM